TPSTPATRSARPVRGVVTACSGRHRTSSALNLLVGLPAPRPRRACPPAGLHLLLRSVARAPGTPAGPAALVIDCAGPRWTGLHARERRDAWLVGRRRRPA